MSYGPYGYEFSQAGLQALSDKLDASNGKIALAFLNKYGAAQFGDFWRQGGFQTNDPVFISQILAQYQSNEAQAATPWYEDPVELSKVGVVALASAGAAGFGAVAAETAGEGGAIAATGAETAGYTVVSGYTPSAEAAAGGAFDIGGGGAALEAASPTLLDRATNYLVNKAETFATNKATAYVNSLIAGKPSTQSVVRAAHLPQENAVGRGGLLGLVYGGDFSPNSASFYGESAGSPISGGSSGGTSSIGFNPLWLIAGFAIVTLFSVFLLRR